MKSEKKKYGRNERWKKRKEEREWKEIKTRQMKWKRKCHNFHQIKPWRGYKNLKPHKKMRYAQLKCIGELRFRTLRKSLTTKADKFLHPFLPRVKNSEVGYVLFFLALKESIPFTLKAFNLVLASCIILSSLSNSHLFLNLVSCYYHPMPPNETVFWRTCKLLQKKKLHIIHWKPF